MPGDATALAHFESAVADGKLYGRPLSVGALLREIVANSYFVARQHGHIVGTAAFRERQHGRVYLSNIAVLPSARRQRIGRTAMNFILSQCPGDRRFELAVHPENAAALALYQSIGFGAVSRSENYFGDGEPRLIMVKFTR